MSQLNDTVTRLIRQDVREMQAYHVQDASGMIKLDAMENPYLWPGDLQQQWTAALADVEVNRYPDPQVNIVRPQLRQLMNIDDKYELLFGNGSDEIIQIIIQAVAGEGALVMAPEPSFVMYKVIADTNRVDYQGVPLNADFSIDMDALCDQMKLTPPSVLFLACPNNPTGNYYGEASLRQVIEACPGLVVIDEAYIAFTDQDALSLLDEYPNVVVMRTLSKVGLAGLRFGLLIGAPAWINEFDKIRMPYNINVLTQLSVTFALEHYDGLKRQCDRLCEERAHMMSTLQAIEGVQVFPSEANFVLVRFPDQADALFAKAKEAGILIKNMSKAHPLLKDCLRLTVGTPEQNKALLAALID